MNRAPKRLCFGYSDDMNKILPLMIAGAVIVVGLLELPRVSAQTSAIDWEKAAGGRRSFDVASVKVADPDAHLRSNINLGQLDSPVKGGLVSASVPVSWYIGFAYKLSGGESQSLPAELPKWATENRFEIEARADGNPTKDQIRLMMQSLLQDRFKLRVHWEPGTASVYLLSLSKPGRTGPQLQPSSQNGTCDPAVVLPAPSAFPFPCGVPTSKPIGGGLWLQGGRNLDMAKIADYLAGPGDLDRPLLDRTGLKGNFDFKIQFAREPNGPDTQPSSEDIGPTFIEALKDQLGLKMESGTSIVNALVIDHIEQPTPN